MSEKTIGRPKTSTRNDATVRIDKSVLLQAQWVAKLRGITVAEYVTEILRDRVQADYVEEGQKHFGHFGPVPQGS